MGETEVYRPKNIGFFFLALVRLTLTHHDHQHAHSHRRNPLTMIEVKKLQIVTRDVAVDVNVKAISANAIVLVNALTMDEITIIATVHATGQLICHLFIIIV